MADFDDNLLAYAMAMGHEFTLREPLPGKAKKVKHRELKLVVDVPSQGRVLRNTEPVAHLIARHFSDRSVAVKKNPGHASGFLWIVADGKTGVELCFTAPSESHVRERMAEVSDGGAPGLVSVDFALQRLASLQAQRRRAVVQKRTAEKFASPAEDSLAARALALSKGGSNFLQSRLLNQLGVWSARKDTNLKLLMSKLGNHEIIVSDLDVSRHDSPEGLEWELDAGESRVVAWFSKLDDTSNQKISYIEWIAPFEEPAAPKKASRGKSKTAG